MTASAWYWGALRSAVAQPDLERAWQLVAAWPRPSTEDREADLALSYLFREVEAGPGGARLIADTAWMLDYYRATAVPIRAEGGPPTVPSGTAREAAGLLEGRAEGVCLQEADHSIFLTLNTSTSGETHLRSWSDLGDFSWRFLRDEEGEGEHITPLYASRPGPAGVSAGRMFRRCGRVLQALLGSEEQEASARLVWDPDIRARLEAEGPALHPDLAWAPQASGELDHEPVCQTRARWRSARPAFLGYARRAGVLRRLSEDAPPDLQEPIRRAQDRLVELGAEEGFGPAEALAILAWKKREVRRRCGPTATPQVVQIQIDRLRIARKARPELEALEAALARNLANEAHERRRREAEARAARLRAALLLEEEENPEEDEDEEDEEEDPRDVRRHRRQFFFGLEAGEADDED